MGADDSPESILSDEEVRALLRDENEPPAPLAAKLRRGAAAATSAPSPEGKVPGERPAVVLASRRRADAGLLSERLASAGFRVDAVRSAFRALDLLRRGRYAAVLTDTRLWADGARLLFDRIEGLAEPPLVILLSDRHAPPSSRAHKAGVAAELLCPLSPMEVAVAVEQLLAVVADRREAAACGERRELIGDPRDLVPSGRPTGAAIGGGAAGDALLASRAALSLGPYRWELPWLRFFLEAQRRLRTGGNRDAVFGALLGLAREVLGAEAAGIAVLTGGETIAHINVAPAGRASLSDVAGLLASPAGDHAPSWSGPAEFSLDVPFPPESDRDATSPRSPAESACRIVILGLSRPIRSAALTFREDLSSLLVEALKRS